jgi:hypothetical protein
MVIPDRAVYLLEDDVLPVDGLYLVHDNSAIFETKQQVWMADEPNIVQPQIDFAVDQSVFRRAANGTRAGLVTERVQLVATLAAPVAPYQMPVLDRGFHEATYDNGVPDQVARIP